MAASNVRPGTRQLLLGGSLLALSALALFWAERRRPLRRQSQIGPKRPLTNIAIGALTLGVVQFIETPVIRPLSALSERRRIGLAQSISGPRWLRDLIAILVMDYTIYVWHVFTHKVPSLWRFHLVHHIDLDLDTTTALRFHVGEILLSIPYRAAQILLIGVSLRALSIWQNCFFISVLFHHSNLRLPLPIERKLMLVCVTPRLHGIHHSAVREHTNSNWSSGLTVWDWLHGTFRFDVPQDEIVTGVPAYRRPSETSLMPSLTMPFRHEREAWPPEAISPAAAEE